MPMRAGNRAASGSEGLRSHTIPEGRCDSATGHSGEPASPWDPGDQRSYGVPAAAVERAVEAGMTYVYWGSMRTAAFAEALRHLAPKRDRFMLVVQSYARLGPVLTWSVRARAQAHRL